MTNIHVGFRTAEGFEKSGGVVDETEIDQHVGKSFVKGVVRPAGGTRTAGSVVQIGTESAMSTDIGTALIVGGGAPGYENVIGGIVANVNTANSNIPAGGAGTGAGDLTDPDGNWNAIIGGYDNVVNGWANQVQSYHSKVLNGASHGTIAGGSIHTIGTDVDYATIGGGTGHSITADNGTISGGVTSTVSGLYGSVGGGLNNSVTARSATVIGGEACTASGTYATVGGLSSTVSGSASSAFGQSNTVSGVSSTAIGRDHLVTSEYSVATGRNASASVPGERAHAADFFTTRGDAQHRNFVIRRITTDATQAELFANSAATSKLPVPADSTWAFSALITARRTDADNESAGYKIEGVVDRNATANTIAFVGTPAVTVLGEDNTAWDVIAAVDTVNGALVFKVTGEASKTIRWVAVVNVAQVIG